MQYFLFVTMAITINLILKNKSELLTGGMLEIVTFIITLIH